MEIFTLWLKKGVSGHDQITVGISGMKNYPHLQLQLKNQSITAPVLTSPAVWVLLIWIRKYNGIWVKKTQVYIQHDVVIQKPYSYYHFPGKIRNDSFGNIILQQVSICLGSKIYRYFKWRRKKYFIDWWNYFWDLHKFDISFQKYKSIILNGTFCFFCGKWW